MKKNRNGDYWILHSILTIIDIELFELVDATHFALPNV